MTDVLTSLPSALREHFRSTDADLQVHLSGWIGLLRRGNGIEYDGWFGFGDEDDPPSTPGQVAAIGSLIAEQAEVGLSILRGVSAALPTIQKMFSDAEWDVRLPVRDSPEVGAAVTVSGLIVHDIPDADAVLGIVLGCDWDREHGLGISLQGTEVLGVGGADAAILGWMARRATAGERGHFAFYGAAPN